MGWCWRGGYHGCLIPIAFPIHCCRSAAGWQTGAWSMEYHQWTGCITQWYRGSCSCRRNRHPPPPRAGERTKPHACNRTTKTIQCVSVTGFEQPTNTNTNPLHPLLVGPTKKQGSQSCSTVRLADANIEQGYQIGGRGMQLGGRVSGGIREGGNAQQREGKGHWSSHWEREEYARGYGNHG